MRRPGDDDHDIRFEAFMSHIAHRLRRVAYLLTHDVGQAEELTQHALVRTYTAWPRIVDADAYAYARRILVNLHSDWWRRLTRRERHPTCRSGGIIDYGVFGRANAEIEVTDFPAVG